MAQYEHLPIYKQTYDLLLRIYRANSVRKKEAAYAAASSVSSIKGCKSWR